MRMELEKVMFMISRKKKNYAYICADANGEYDTNSLEKVNIKGMLPTRRDNCKMTSDLFMKCIMMRFNNKTAFDVFMEIRNVAIQVMKGKIDYDNLVISGSVSESYSSATAMMSVFSEECALRGTPIPPGRVEYVVVKEKEKGDVIGKRMRIAYPKTDEPCDPVYYLRQKFYKPLDDLFKVLYPELPAGQYVFNKKKVPLNAPCKAIVMALTEGGDINATTDWYNKEYAKTYPSINVVSSFFMKRT